MGRLPKIILMIAAMTAIFLWISTAFNSCGTKADDLLDDSAEFLDEVSDDDLFDDADDDIFANDSDDDLFEDDFADDSFVEGDEADNSDYLDPEPDYTTTTSAPAVTTSSPRTTSSYGGEYMVIAGNYLVKSNANVMIRKLANLGYPNSDIGVFDRSQYHTVIAYRSDSYSSAMEVSNAIKRQGVDCYVKKKEY